MAYFSPYVDQTGLNVPQYADIDAYILAQYLSIYAQSIDTGNNNADIQMWSIIALLINDAMQTALLTTNSRSPSTAVGSDLDGVVKVNGIARKQASYSSVALTVTGTPGTVIAAGLAQDSNGNLWALPLNLTIPSGGSIIVTAVCQTIGAITAAANAINLIANPQSGWTSVTNAAAVPTTSTGQPAETDSQLRGRQGVSVALPSQTLVIGTLAAIAAVSGVTRYNNGNNTVSGASPIENPTGSTDTFGNPAHSISMVAEGGTDLAVATAIYVNKTPGCLTNAGTSGGATTVTVTDPTTGATINIGFARPTYVPIYVSLSVHGIPSLTTATQTAIQTAIVNYLNALQIGETITISGLYAAAMAVMPNILLPLFSIQALKAGITSSPTGTTDITLDYYQVAQGVTGNVIVTSV